MVLSDDLYLNMVSSFGEKYQYDQVHAKAVAGLAVSLFEILKERHRLGELALNLLRHAALIHDVGLFISVRKHHKSSACLVMIDQSLDDYPQVERRMLALLVRNHRKEVKLNGAELSSHKKDTVLKLIAILRVADVLDYFHDGKAVIKDVHIDKNKCVINVDGINLADISKQLKDKAAFFKEAFGLKAVFTSTMDITAEIGEGPEVEESKVEEPESAQEQTNDSAKEMVVS